MFNVTTNETEVTVDGLFPHTNYIFKVAAGNSIGVGPFSATLLTHTAEDGMYTCMPKMSHYLNIMKHFSI